MRHRQHASVIRADLGRANEVEPIFMLRLGYVRLWVVHVDRAEMVTQFRHHIAHAGAIRRCHCVTSRNTR